MKTIFAATSNHISVGKTNYISISAGLVYAGFLTPFLEGTP